MLTMATTALGTLLQNLRRSLRCREGDFSDSDLLDCFIARRDELAFTALMERHGPMVLGVCRRILRNEADAEDAFQAVFLVLVRKAASIHPRARVGNRLYGVAHSTALKARAMRSKRWARESEAAARPRPEHSAHPANHLTELLDQELTALPDKYRAPIVLCDLEGSSIKKAAQQLGCPPGTIGTRLARGRSLLSRRLARHGLAVSGGTIATAIVPNAAHAVPPLLMNSTLRAAIVAATGRAMAAGVISARVATLTEGVLNTMLLTKLKLTAVALSAIAVVLIAASLTFSARAVAPPQLGKADQPGAGAAGRDEKPRGDNKEAAVAVALPEAAGGAEEITVATVPPVVVQTVPKAGTTDVDPELKEIKVIFSKDMRDGSWSWSSLSKATFPKVDGKIKYLEDKRTCVLPVKLEPDKTYSIWVNSEKFTSFKDADGRSAVPYLLVFQTKK
jgi:RNA polymerase sigma-70 factor (ECF subfamily)